jgi:hypothetical protein
VAVDARHLAALEREIQEEMLRREKSSPTSFFPWHEIQEWVLNDSGDLARKDVRILLACGGNRGGKSALGKGIYSDVMRRKSPLAKKLRMTDRITGDVRRKGPRDPITVWIIPPTLEKARQDWVNPSDGYSIKYWLGDLYIDEKKTPDHVFYSRPPGLEPEEAKRLWGLGEYEHFDKTILKSHDQDLLSFEASAVDLAIVDEEIMDEKKWNSILLRIGTPNGSVVMCYTPLHGLSWSYDRYWRPLIKLGTARRLGTRRWIHDEGDGSCVVAVQFGAGDNPLAVEYAKEIQNDPGMSEAEKAARLHGEYGFVEGALIPNLSGIDILSPDSDHEVFVVDILPGMEDQSGGEHRLVPGKIIEWILMTDPNKSYGALLVAVDNAGNLFFVSEHLEEAWPDRKHAEAFRAMERKWVKYGQPIRRIADPGSAGAHSIVNMADLGLFFETMEKSAGSVGESIKKLRSLTWVDPDHHHPITGKKGAPRVYFFRPGVVSRWKDKSGRLNIACRLADQISLARQTDNENAPPDTPHKSVRSKLDLFDCARYAAMVAKVWTEEEDEHPSQPRMTDDKLPKLPLNTNEDHIDPLDRDIYTPFYEFV